MSFNATSAWPSAKLRLDLISDLGEPWPNIERINDFLEIIKQVVPTAKRHGAGPLPRQFRNANANSSTLIIDEMVLLMVVLGRCAYGDNLMLAITGTPAVNDPIGLHLFPMRIPGSDVGMNQQQALNYFQAGVLLQQICEGMLERYTSSETTED